MSGISGFVINISIEYNKQMFDNIFNRKKNQSQNLQIPPIKYTTDSTKINKMNAKSLTQLVTQMNKYIDLLVSKLKYSQQLQRNNKQKIQISNQKINVINKEIVKMNNQHQELNIKFNNLQQSLNQMSQNQATIIKKQNKTIIELGQKDSKFSSIQSILQYYRTKAILCQRVIQQNKQIKAQFALLQDKLREIEVENCQKTENNSADRVTQESLMQGENNLAKLQNEQIQNDSSSKETNQKLRKQIDKKNINILMLNKQIDLLKKKVQDNGLLQNNDLVTNIKEQLIEAKKQLAHKAKLIQQIKDKNAEKENYCKYLEEQIQKFKEKGYKHNDQVKEKAQVQQENSKEDTETENMRAQIVQIREQIKKLRAENEQIKAQNELIKAQNEQISAQKKQIKAQNEQIKAQNEQIRAQNQQMRQQLQAAQKQQQRLKSQIKKLIVKNERIAQQKSTLQQANQQNYKALAKAYDNLQEEYEQVKEERATLRIQKSNIEQKNKIYESEIKNLLKIQQVNQQNLKMKQQESGRLNEALQRKQAQMKQKQQELQEREEDIMIRQRKYQSELNQEKIKNQSIKRNIVTLEGKIKQNQETINKMYDDNIIKDKKNAQMEIKLKQYKKIIQLLKKQKNDIQKQIQHQLSPQTQIPGKIVSTQPQTNINSEQYNQLKNKAQLYQKLNYQITSLEEYNKVLKGENQQLRTQIKALEEEVALQKAKADNLEEKRKANMKQINKIRNNSGHWEECKDKKEQHSMMNNTMKEQEGSNQKVKKVAAKAYKGLDIILKLSQGLYKNYLNIFINQLHKPDVKEIQGQINSIANKSMDMKDIFQDYL